MGWPKFVQNSWAATCGRRVGADAYGPTVVNAMAGGQQVADHRGHWLIRLRNRCGCEFRAEEFGELSVALRVPGWCSNATISVNGQIQSGVLPGPFFRIQRTGPMAIWSMSICRCRFKHCRARASRSRLIAGRWFIRWRSAKIGLFAHRIRWGWASMNLNCSPPRPGITRCNWIHESSRRYVHKFYHAAKPI